jgi:hypothetical protein
MAGSGTLPGKTAVITGQDGLNCGETMFGWSSGMKMVLALEKGFYYDIDLGGKEINPDDFKAIEDKMLELAKQKNEFKRQEISKADAIAYFEQKGDEYKLDLLKDLADGTITFYKQGNFISLNWNHPKQSGNNVIAVTYKEGDNNFEITIVEKSSNKEMCQKISTVIGDLKSIGGNGSFRVNENNCGAIVNFDLKNFNKITDILNNAYSKLFM